MVLVRHHHTCHNRAHTETHMTTLVTHMTRIRWRVSLALERYANKVAFEVRYPRDWQLNMKNGSMFDDFVDRVSPWIPYGGGYRRTRLRRWLYRLRYPRHHFTNWAYARLDSLLGPWSSHPGRYEGNTSELIARWLDSHDFISDEDLGSVDEYGSYFMLATGEFPWGTGYYITQSTDTGFFSVMEYDTLEDAQVRWNGIRIAYEHWLDYDQSPSYDDTFFTPDEIVRANSLSSDGGQA
jgi:hypothetical protein